MSRARLALVLFSVVLFATASHAQLPPNSSTTATPIPGSGHDYLGSQIDTVNPASGSVSVRIPVIIPLSRGITLPFAFAYDSSGVNYLKMATTSGTGFWNTIGTSISEAGWSDTVPIASSSLETW